MSIVELRTYSQMDLDRYLNSRITDNHEIKLEQERMVRELVADALPFCKFTTKEDKTMRSVVIGVSLTVVPLGVSNDILIQQLNKMEGEKDILFKKTRSKGVNHGRAKTYD